MNLSLRVQCARTTSQSHSFDVCCAVLGRLILPRMQDVRLHLPTRTKSTTADFEADGRPTRRFQVAQRVTISSWNVCRDTELSTHVGLCD
jgi:hypothetical protein